MILYAVLLTLALWLLLVYVPIGMWFAWDEQNRNKRMIMTLFWIFVPFFANKAEKIAEFMEPKTIEGICNCKRRLVPGEKYCSICGGKVKDRLWRKR